MTLAHAPFTVLPAPGPDELEARWDAATTRPKMFQDGWSIDNSPDYYRLQTIVERWALTVAGEDGLTGVQDDDSVGVLSEAVYQEIHRRVIEWATARRIDALKRRTERDAS